MGATDDLRWMSLALSLARSQQGRTAPNPSVGCALVKEGHLIALGATQDGGRPHAERVALDAAGDAARGATAYVTLEPCAHYGQTPPCAKGLIDAGVSRVVIACRDEFAEVAGRGIAMLEEADIPVELGLFQTEAEALYEGFFHRLQTGRPLVYVDRARRGYDAELDPDDGALVERRLFELGQAGKNRVRVEPETPLAEALLEQGLARIPHDSRHTQY
ncbi:bifunctional diaminohydroxyphosphoribosylaminopyrimidine deaminase/5-amino-6-(5-phosphoribosylamino)uracil reductase RibD [Maricaulis parjimensis]|uniref:bifunctional diaminohydroxyphosphoribosylaminopyrimidine deaminase/5-amino-6-(5-phosphoribosylamino)uracil reductase RibD n=1 Tax=Maricaulis parjimensis TaxID=144023 RepID=UPI00193AD70D|nr:bifunctional diaminohydroxyphosphoribosylaminopyrimidine deaminase/5-amino-6-(5-phosphoribosylamino)uracil reductase RibD [Maricaulis parjimensis]